MWRLIGLPLLLPHIIHAAPLAADPLDPNLRPHHGPERKPSHTLPIISTSTIFDAASTPLSIETITVLTFATPSPSADPIPITTQSQLITFYIPVPTVCTTAPPQAPPYAFTFNASNAHPTSHPQSPSYNSTLAAPHNLTHPHPRPMSRPQPPPYTFSLRASAPQHQPLHTAPASTAPSATANQNEKRQYPILPDPIFSFNLSLPEPTRFRDQRSCTSYIPTVTPICHTTLSHLAAAEIPITECGQVVTFSTDHGYSLLPTTAAGGGGNHSGSRNATGRRGGGIQTITSFWLAPWQAVASGVPGGVSTGWESTSSNQEVYVNLVTSTTTSPEATMPDATSAAALTGSGTTTTTTTSFKTSTTTKVDTVTETAGVTTV